MTTYLKRHEAFVRRALDTEGAAFDWAGLARFHAMQIAFVQQERLTHLLVTLAFGFFALATVLVFALRPGAALAALILLLLALLVPYLVHYFRLENGVQRWYHLANAIEGRAGHISQDYGAPAGPTGQRPRS